nr:hypothetical protein CFP56_24605 [Quercus suber]
MLMLRLHESNQGEVTADGLLELPRQYTWNQRQEKVCYGGTFDNVCTPVHSCSLAVDLHISSCEGKEHGDYEAYMKRHTSPLPMLTIAKLYHRSLKAAWHNLDHDQRLKFERLLS